MFVRTIPVLVDCSNRNIRDYLVDVSDFVDSYLYNRISEIVRDLPKGATVKKVKSKCPEGFRRSTIRMVMADLKRKLKE